MDRILATYRINALDADIHAQAEALAVEQSVEMPLAAIRQASVHERTVGRVAAIEPDSAGAFRVTLSLAAETTGEEAAQLVNMLFGNASIHRHIELLDAELPASLLSAFPGPRFGIAGVRERLGAFDRPLTATALKPQGLTPAELAELAHTFALGGIDIIKDDHGMANQRYAPFARRVQACQRAVGRANTRTGRRTVYAPHLSGGPSALFEQARIAREEGVGMVLVAPMLIGLPVLQELVTEHLSVPVLAHPAFAGGRVSPAFLLGKLFRLLGADAVIYPNHGGRFAYDAAACAAIAAAARSPWSTLRPALPVPAGGMNLERVDEMTRFYGNDTVLLIGGALLAAGDQLLERSREFATRVAGGQLKRSEP